MLAVLTEGRMVSRFLGRVQTLLLRLLISLEARVAFLTFNTLMINEWLDGDGGRLWLTCEDKMLWAEERRNVEELFNFLQDLGWFLCENISVNQQHLLLKQMKNKVLVLQAFRTGLSVSMYLLKITFGKTDVKVSHIKE